MYGAQCRLWVKGALVPLMFKGMGEGGEGRGEREACRAGMRPCPYFLKDR